ncbi:MAG: hypothetical protein V4689_21525 [Verrucomicrobiota bacterium]
MKTFIHRSVTIATWATILTARLAADPFVNGGFESDLAGWEVIGNVSTKSVPPYGPTEGTKLAAFNSSNSTPNGLLRQFVATIPGHRYKLEFDVGNLSYNAQHQRLQVNVGEVIGVTTTSHVSDVIDIAGPGEGATAWIAAVYEFPSIGNSVGFVFSDVSQATNSLDLVLDHVRLTELPATAPLGNGGFESGLTGWHPAGNVSAQSTPPYLPTEGNSLAAFNATNSTPNGSLKRELMLVPDQRYRLEFDVGNLSYNSQHQRLQVIVWTIWGYKQLNRVFDTIDIPGSGGGTTAWVAASYEFISTGSFGSISFTDVSSATNSLDLVLDNVRLTPLPPGGQFVNGSFESGLEGWTASTDPGGASAKSTPPYVPTDGAMVAAFNSANLPNFGSLIQTIDTIPGKTYQLLFDVGNLAYNPQSQSLRTLIDFGNQRVINRVTNVPSTSFSGGTNWLRGQHYEFTAIGTRATITFIDASNTTNGVDLVLDHVRMAP